MFSHVATLLAQEAREGHAMSISVKQSVSVSKSSCERVQRGVC